MNQPISKISFSGLLPVFATILFSIVMWGCDNTLDPLDEEAGVFSMYGALDINEEENYIRANMLNYTIDDTSHTEFAGTMYLENLDTGDIEELRDTMIVSDGVRVFNFRTDMDIYPEHQYRAKIIGDEGGEIESVAKAPNIADFRAYPQQETCDVPITIEVDSVKTGQLSRLEVGIYYSGQLMWTGLPLQLQYSPDPWDHFSLRMMPRSIFLELFDMDIHCHHLDSEKIYIRYHHLGDDLIVPSNGESADLLEAEGRFGIFYSAEHEITIDTTNVCFPFC